MKSFWLSMVCLGWLTACATTEPTVTQVLPPRSLVAAPPAGDEPLWPASAPVIHARSAILIDARTGQTLYQKFADTHTQVASTQKLMTALVIVDSGNLDGPVKIARADTTVEPSKLGVHTGEVYPRRQLLTAMLVKSENDCAAALARDQAGDISSFAGEMNRKAREIGANNSFFVNPHGLPAPQYSTARDMARIAFRVHQDSLLRQIVGTEYYTFTFANGHSKLLQSTDKLLGPGSIFTGMKTGYTDSAGRCLVSSASYGGHDLILVQLGSHTSYIFNDAQRMMSWAYGSGGGSTLATAY